MTLQTDHLFQLSSTGPVRSRLEEAEGFFLQGNLNEALAATQQAWREQPQDADVYRVLAYLHMARGEYPPAAQAAYQAVYLDGDNITSFATLIQVYVTFNCTLLAREALSQAQARFPEHLQGALFVLGADLFFRQRREKEALAFLSRALAWNPHDAYAQALNAQYLLRHRQYAAALATLREVIAVYPQRWDYLRDYGSALLHAGDYAEALAVLTQSMRLNPADAPTKQLLFLAHRLQRDRSNFYWRLVRWCYDFTGVAWLLNVAGLISTLWGVIWGIVLLEQDAPARDAMWTAILLILGGVVFLGGTQQGILLHRRKGRAWDEALWRVAEQEPRKE